MIAAGSAAPGLTSMGGAIGQMLSVLMMQMQQRVHPQHPMLLPYNRMLPQQANDQMLSGEHQERTKLGHLRRENWRWPCNYFWFLSGSSECEPRLQLGVQFFPGRRWFKHRVLRPRSVFIQASFAIFSQWLLAQAPHPTSEVCVPAGHHRDFFPSGSSLKHRILCPRPA